MNADKNRILLIVAVGWLVMIGLFVRVWGLGEYYFSPDEMLILIISRGETLARVWQSSLPQLHPPFHFFFLHYMLEISKNVLFLRSTSLIPGLGLIIVFFFLGRKVSGTVSGLAMASMAAFSSAAIILSQVIRPYAMLVFFISVALWFFLSYLEAGKKKHLYGYLFFILLALSFHYSAVIPMTAVGLAWIARIVANRRPAREYGLIIVSHLPHLAMVGALYFYHLTTILGSKHYEELTESYLHVFFPSSLSGLTDNIYDFYAYLFFPPIAPLIVALATLGIVAIWKTSHRYIAVIIIATFTINYILTFLKLYPFGGVRHSFYLFPMAALLVGASLQYAFRFIVHFSVSLNLRSWVESHRSIFIKTAFFFFITSTLTLTFYLVKIDYFKPSALGNLGWEVPLKHVNYSLTMNYLTTNIKQGDIILMNGQSTHYIYWKAGHYNPNYLSDRLGKISYQGFDYYHCTRLWRFNDNDQLMKAIKDLNNHVSLNENSTIWLLDLGYSWQGLKHLDPAFVNIIDEKVEVTGGNLYTLDAKFFYQLLED